MKKDKAALDDSIYEGHAARIWGNARIFADERKTGKVMRPEAHIKRIASELRASSESVAAILLRNLVLDDRDKMRDNSAAMKMKIKELEGLLKNEKQKLEAAKKRAVNKKSKKEPVIDKPAEEIEEPAEEDNTELQAEMDKCVEFEDEKRKLESAV